MCGIAGLVDLQGDTVRHREVLDEMQRTLNRRGPDERGQYLSEDVCLAHSRLSVIDVEHGKQPMTEQIGDDTLVLVYNGELYNTEELRKELLARGHKFRERSDTEVLLRTYLEWGRDCVQHLNGIYAFAIWDTRSRSLFAARDRMGVKPFFYCLVAGELIFGSEIKTLLCHHNVLPELRVEGISEIFLLGPGRTPGCGVLDGIEELRPGEYLVFSGTGLEKERYWWLEAQPHEDSFEETQEKTAWLLKDAIRRQTVSDVPLGAFLSGGLDSSAICAVSGIRKTFSVDYQDNDKYFQVSKFQPNSDNTYIKQMTDFLKTDHTSIVVDTEDLVQALFDAVEARDLPGMADVDSSLLLFCRAVKKEVTVALSGECADEIFGGYPWYRDEKILNADGFPWSRSTDYRLSFLRRELRDQVSPDYAMDRYGETLAETTGLPGEEASERRMREMFRLNTDWFMQTLLDRKDRMSMYSGLEVRVPFCDHRIAEYLYNVPWSLKNYKGREKGLLRQALTGVLPDEVLWRKKSPYPKTHHPAYLARVSELLWDILHNPASPLLELADRQTLEGLLNGGDVTQPWYGQLMTRPQTIAYFIQMNYWMEKYHVRLKTPER